MDFIAVLYKAFRCFYMGRVGFFQKTCINGLDILLYFFYFNSFYFFQDILSFILELFISFLNLVDFFLQSFFYFLYINSDFVYWKRLNFI